MLNFHFVMGLGITKCHTYSHLTEKKTNLKTDFESSLEACRAFQNPFCVSFPNVKNSGNKPSEDEYCFYFHVILENILGS